MKKIFFVLLFFSSIFTFAQNKTEEYIIKYKDFAIAEMNQYGIPASITLAQGILESGSGDSRLAVEGNNHFGIKCHDNWNGETIFLDDDKKGECFRKYSKESESYRDHSLFLIERERYISLFKLSSTNYRAWAKGLKKAGYATNPKYSSLIIDLIEKYNLQQYDKEGEKVKQLHFAHSYGFPYLTGIGIYYFRNKSLYFVQVNTSFVFSALDIGYNHKLINKFYIGTGGGIFYSPTKKTDILPKISVELIHKKGPKNKRYNSVLIRLGMQYQLEKTEYQSFPYLKLVFILK